MDLLKLGLIIVIVAGIAPPARAQADAQSDAQRESADVKDRTMGLVRKVGVHLNTSFRNPVDPDVSKGQTYGISIGMSPGRTNGWKYPVGLTMFSENLHSPNGEQFAVLNSKAILAGIGYKLNFGRLATSASLQTGFAVNRGRMDGDVPRAFNAPPGAVSLDVGNSPLARSQVKAEYFLTEKLTLRATADYMMIRPSIVVVTPTERLTDRWDASSVHANFGIGFYPFRQ